MRVIDATGIADEAVKGAAAAASGRKCQREATNSSFLLSRQTFTRLVFLSDTLLFAFRWCTATSPIHTGWYIRIRL